MMPVATDRTTAAARALMRELCVICLFDLLLDREPGSPCLENLL
jgi:hypothetical protein